MTENVVCPVCNEPFATMEAATTHMKAEHPDEFKPPITIHTAKTEPINVDALAMVPPGMLELLDQRVATQIQAAIEAERPQIAEAVRGAIQQVLEQAKVAGISVPGVTSPGGAPGGGVVPGSPVTSEGMALMQMILGQQQQGTGMEQLASTLTQARAISDVLNPPSIWDRVMQNAVLRSLSKSGLITDSEVKELLVPPAKPNT